ncbi:MAG: SDR family NAD(P)-dependent oxidoreductase [Alphaproteobacteria bacterium]|jgi:NAD(P)-dependent dehydrogenase (short-subunit alcohol dehydrogenase family)|nr:SDR family NAD(P)-dependent oxidoreductase [Alphaproteobacteria bacterium]
MTNLAGKSVLVVGASRGIGAATARAFAAAGASVALAARSDAACREIAEAIEAEGGRAVAMSCDVADYPSVRRTVDRTIEALGGLDVVINNAGVIDPISRFAESDPGTWAENIRINLVGAMHVARAALPHLARDRGTLVNVSSGAAHRPLEGWSAYCAGKAGLAMLTRALHLEEGERVRVFGFRPGVVDTEMQVQIRASGLNPVSQLKRTDLAPAEEPAKAMVYLATPAADDLTGTEPDIREPEFRARAGLPD